MNNLYGITVGLGLGLCIAYPLAGLPLIALGIAGAQIRSNSA